MLFWFRATTMSLSEMRWNLLDCYSQGVLVGKPMTESWSWRGCQGHAEGLRAVPSGWRSVEN
jgi:hypothetical protein